MHHLNLHLSFCVYNVSCFFSWFQWAITFSNFIGKRLHSGLIVRLSSDIASLFFLLQILTSVRLRCITVMPILCVSTCLGYIAVTVSRDISAWMTSRVQVRIKEQYCFSDSTLLCTISVLLHLAPSALSTVFA